MSDDDDDEQLSFDDDDDDDDDEPEELDSGEWVRRDHPDTSRQAAKQSRFSAKSQNGVLLVYYHDAGARGLTEFEALDLMKWGPGRVQYPNLKNVRPRVVDLRKKYHYVYMDESCVRINDSGFKAHPHVFIPDEEDRYIDWLRKTNPNGETS